MMGYYLYRIAVFCTVALTLAASSSAQRKPDPSQLIKLSVILDGDTLSRQKPAVATVTVENISGRDIEFKSIWSFDLLSMRKEAVARNHSVFGDSYWSPVNPSTGEPLRLNIMDPALLKKGVVEGRVPETLLHLTKGEVKRYNFNPTKLLWNASMGNDWPRWNLFDVVPKGTYSLFFKIESAGHVKSNELKVSVE
jgi:hypothetical protein